MSVSRTAPQSSALVTRNTENDKKYKKALRFIYKYGQEHSKLTEEAQEACKRQGINQEDLAVKQVEDFAVHPNQQRSARQPKNRHEADLLESEASLAIVRHKHHENRRRSKCIF